MSQRIGTAIVGIGRWGRKIAGVLHSISDLAAFASGGSRENVGWMSEHCASARGATLAEICGNPAIQAVAVATPISSHVAIAQALVNAGKHVFVEKPLGTSAAPATALARLASERQVRLATGYILLYHPAYREMKRLIDPSQIRRIEFRWTKFGTFGETIELNLLSHHLALSLDWLGEPLRGEMRKGPGERSACDAVETRLHYGNAEVVSNIDRHATSHAHTMTVDLAGGERCVWDGDVLSCRGRDASDARIAYRASQDALNTELMQFLEAVEKPSQPLPTQGRFAADVLHLLEGLGEASRLLRK